MKAVNKYQRKFYRRPILFWWQAVALFGMIALLAREVPPLRPYTSAPLRENSPPPPSAAYAALDPDYAAQLLRRSLTAWMAGRAESQGFPGLDLALDSANALPPPEFLERSGVLPLSEPASFDNTRWHSMALESVWTPPPLAGELRHSVPPRAPKDGLFIELSPPLSAAGFTFPTDTLKALTPPRGECRFYVETDGGGEAVHVLTLSPPSDATPPLERALMRGRAQGGGAASGTVNIRWSFEK